MPASISIVVPLFNEQENVYELYQRLQATVNKLQVSYEIIFVDDGSTDLTLTALEKIAAENNGVKFISFSRNFGHQLALYAGLEKCTGDTVVLIDGDLQDPPETIEVLWNKMKEGYDAVYAKRSLRKGESFLKKFTAAVF